MQLLRRLPEIERTIVAIGSHDLVLDLAATALRSSDPTLSLVSTNVGSLGGLVALRDGLCHLAGSHLLHPATGEYTLPYLDEMMGDRDLAVVRLVHRDQGLIVPSGNPRGITGLADLAGGELSYVNRQRGAGTRMLLDQELRRLGIDPVDGQRLRARGAHPPGGRRGGRGRARRLRPGHPRGRAGVRAGLRADGAGALRPGGRGGQPRPTRCSPRCGSCWTPRTSTPRCAALGGYSTEETGVAGSGDTVHPDAQMIQKAQEVAERIATDVLAGRLAPGDPVPTVRALARQLGCAPGTAARAHGILREAGRDRRCAPVARRSWPPDGVAAALVMGAHVGVVRLSGSDDPALDLLLSAAGAAVERAGGGRGSVAGLGMLAQGAVDAAAVHLRDAAHRPVQRRVRPPGARRRARPAGAPVEPRAGHRGAEGQPVGHPGRRRPGRRRLAWRPPGTGSRLLLNRLLLRGRGRPRARGRAVRLPLRGRRGGGRRRRRRGAGRPRGGRGGRRGLRPGGVGGLRAGGEPAGGGPARPAARRTRPTSVHQRVSRLGGYDLSRSGESRVAA